jgi:hypothetical protein
MDDLLTLMERWQQLWLSMDDPADRAEWAAARAEELRAAAERMSDLRARGLAELHVDGWSYTRIAREALGGLSGSSRSLAQKLVERGREVVPPR